MELPEDTDQLKELLGRHSARFSRAIEDSARRAERADLEARRAILIEHLDTLSGQSARLHSLGMEDEAADARDLTRAVRDELARITKRLGELSGERLKDPPSDESERPEPAPPAIEPPATPEPEPEIPWERMNDLAGRVRNLDDGAEHLDNEELKCRMNILAGELRLLQDESPGLSDEDSPGGKQLYQCFRTLTRLAGESKQYVYGINRRHEKVWRAHIDEWTEKLALHETERKDREERAREERAAEARRAELNRKNLAARNEVFEELRELIQGESPDPDEIVDLAAEMLHVHDPGQSPEDRLVELLSPHAGLFDDKGGDFRSLRKAFKRRTEASGRNGTAAGSTRVIEPDEFHRYFKGARAAMVGGNRREYRREKLQEYFGFDELEWIESERNERADARALAQRIENGRYDVVFMLQRFCSHSLHDAVKAACKSHGDVPFVLVERGYGQRQFSAALKELGDHLPARG